MAAVNAQPDVDARAARAAGGAAARRRHSARPARRVPGRRGRRARRAPRARGQRGGVAGDAQALGRGHARDGAQADPAAGEVRGRRDRLRPRRGQAEEEPAVRRQDAGPGDAAADRVFGRRRADAGRARQLRRHRLDHADHQPDRDHHQQRHRHGGGRQRGGVQRPPVRGAHVGVPGAPLQRRDRRGGRAREPARLRRAADDRERRDADAPPGRPPAGGHRRAGRGQGGDGERQEGDRGGAGESARGRRRDRGPGRRGGQHRAGRVDRQQHPVHGGEGDRRGRVDRRRAGRAAGAQRVPGRQRTAAARAGEGGAGAGQDAASTPTRTSSARTPPSSRARSASTPGTSCGCWSRRSTRSTRSCSWRC